MDFQIVKVNFKFDRLLGEGYSVEEQITGTTEFGGIQIEVFPMRPEIFEKRFPVKLRNEAAMLARGVSEIHYSLGDVSLSMGLAPGGRMRQEIYDDPFSIHDWDLDHGSRCFIHLVNSATWQAITGQRPPSQPPTAKQYTAAGYPWFDYFDAEVKAVNESKILAAVKSVFSKGGENSAKPHPENESTSVTQLIKLRAGLKTGQVREADFSA